MKENLRITQTSFWTLYLGIDLRMISSMNYQGMTDQWRRGCIIFFFPFFPFFFFFNKHRFCYRSGAAVRQRNRMSARAGCDVRAAGKPTSTVNLPDCLQRKHFLLYASPFLVPLRSLRADSFSPFGPSFTFVLSP